MSWVKYTRAELDAATAAHEEAKAGLAAADAEGDFVTIWTWACSEHRTRHALDRIRRNQAT